MDDQNQARWKKLVADYEASEPIAISREAATGRVAGTSLGRPIMVVQTIADPLSRTTTLARDWAGWVTSQALPGNRTVSFVHDASGNMTSLTPPGRPAHGIG